MEQAAVSKQVTAWDIGTHVTLTTCDSKDISGEVLAHDEGSRLLVLKQPGSTPFNSNVTMFSIDSIQSIVSVVPSTTGKDARLPYIETQRCQERENKAIAAAELEAAKVGVGVTPEAQRIFDALAKTMPCQWRGRTIVVLDEVSIVPPYDGTSCSQLTPNAKLFDRVQKVLAAERSRLGL